jgi:pyridoxal phosphate enzyme (YggS family)
MIEPPLSITAGERIRQNLESVRGRIDEAARRSGRDPESVTLVAVTKKWPVRLVRPLIEAGAVDLGENFPQELWRKVEELSDLGGAIRWHLIGHLQTNKARRTLPMVRQIHAVDSLKLLRLLDALVGELRLATPPPVCLQVNTSGEESKHGWTAAGIIGDSDAIAACGSIPVLGLMTMAAWGTDAGTARPSFILLRETRDLLRGRTGLPLPDLSMGMSADFESAVEEGATHVRIGSALLEGVEG